MQGHDYIRDLQIFLLNYRSTPHSSTLVSPAKLLFGRELKTKLPTWPSSDRHIAARRNDARAKHMMKTYGDTARRCTIKTLLEKGESVLVKNPKQGKLQPNFTTTPLTVIKTKGSMVTARNIEGKEISRNRSWFKRFREHREPAGFPIPQYTEDVWDDAITPDNTRGLPEIHPPLNQPIQPLEDPRGQETTARHNPRPERNRRPPRYFMFE